MNDSHGFDILALTIHNNWVFLCYISRKQGSLAMKLEHHILVCMNQRPQGHPRGSCGSVGAGSVFEAFRAETEKRGLFERVMVTGTFCMGPCERGPTVVVYPEGVWYGQVQPGDVAVIFDEHLGQGKPVERLRLR